MRKEPRLVFHSRKFIVVHGKFLSFSMRCSCLFLFLDMTSSNAIFSNTTNSTRNEVSRLMNVSCKNLFDSQPSVNKYKVTFMALLHFVFSFFYYLFFFFSFFFYFAIFLFNLFILTTSVATMHGYSYSSCSTLPFLNNSYK